MIQKTAVDKNNSYKPLYYYQSARAAFEDILCSYRDFTLLLPGYIGFSPKEGSGIYDPVVNSGIRYFFYPMNKKLEIDLRSFESVLTSIKAPKIVLLVHYFGYPDINMNKIVELCEKENAIIIEDAAHGLFTDFVDHNCGQYGNYVLYSLHKMLPFENGGMLKVNSPSCKFIPQRKLDYLPSPFNYDFRSIAEKRKINTKFWVKYLQNKKDLVTIIRPFSNDVTPQTFPIIVNEYDRNKLYFKLNECGFGAVSLYHTMIEPIEKGGFADTLWLSQHIINLPVHQDVDVIELRKMADELVRIIKSKE